MAEALHDCRYDGYKMLDGYPEGAHDVSLSSSEVDCIGRQPWAIYEGGYDYPSSVTFSKLSGDFNEHITAYDQDQYNHHHHQQQQQQQQQQHPQQQQLQHKTEQQEQQQQQQTPLRHPSTPEELPKDVLLAGGEYLLDDDTIPTQLDSPNQSLPTSPGYYQHQSPRQKSELSREAREFQYPQTHSPLGCPDQWNRNQDQPLQPTASAGPASAAYFQQMRCMMPPSLHPAPQGLCPISEHRGLQRVYNQTSGQPQQVVPRDISYPQSMPDYHYGASPPGMGYIFSQPPAPHSVQGYSTSAYFSDTMGGIPRPGESYSGPYQKFPCPEPSYSVCAQNVAHGPATHSGPAQPPLTHPLPRGLPLSAPQQMSYGDEQEQNRPPQLAPLGNASENVHYGRQAEHERRSAPSSSESHRHGSQNLRGRRSKKLNHERSNRKHPLNIIQAKSDDDDVSRMQWSSTASSSSSTYSQLTTGSLQRRRRKEATEQDQQQQYRRKEANLEQQQYYQHYHTHSNGTRSRQPWHGSAMPFARLHSPADTRDRYPSSSHKGSGGSRRTVHVAPRQQEHSNRNGSAHYRNKEEEADDGLSYYRGGGGRAMFSNKTYDRRHSTSKGYSHAHDTNNYTGDRKRVHNGSGNGKSSVHDKSSRYIANHTSISHYSRHNDGLTRTHTRYNNPDSCRELTVSPSEHGGCVTSSPTPRAYDPLSKFTVDDNECADMMEVLEGQDSAPSSDSSSGHSSLDSMYLEHPDVVLLHPLSKLNDWLLEDRLVELGIALVPETEWEIKRYMDFMHSEQLQVALCSWRAEFQGKYSGNEYGALGAFPELMRGGVFFPDMLRSTEPLVKAAQHTEDLLPLADPYWPWSNRGRIVISENQEQALMAMEGRLRLDYSRKIFCERRQTLQTTTKLTVQHNVLPHSNGEVNGGTTRDSAGGVGEDDCTDDASISTNGTSQASRTSKCMKFGQRLDAAVLDCVIYPDYRYFSCPVPCCDILVSDVCQELQLALEESAYIYWQQRGGIEFDAPKKRRPRDHAKSSHRRNNPSRAPTYHRSMHHATSHRYSSSTTSRHNQY